MAKARKTVDVASIVSFANTVLKCSNDKDFPTYNTAVLYRSAIMTMTENLLMEAGAYKGFRYLTVDDIGFDMWVARPGMNTDANGEMIENIDARYTNTDSTRVQYFQ